MSLSQNDTIAAVSTPPGEGAIGIVRLSGPRAIEIAQGIFVSSTGRRLDAGRGRVFHGEIRDGARSIDEVLVHVMRAPHSYTREDVVEVNTHGGAALVEAILELALCRGARLAHPGEFTKRAFLNKRIDLVQAEAVIDRIRARGDAALRAASGAASGGLSRAITALCDTLADALARIEAAIDFPDEDLPELVDDALRARLESARNDAQRLLNTAHAGRMYREGAALAITGRPNVGKSSLFNALLRDTRAIVTAAPGTTRDLLEEAVNIRGVAVRLIDTAGLRHAHDEAEQLGVAAARGAVERADAVLLLVDAAAGFMPEDEAIARDVLALGVPALLVVNKIDLATPGAVPEWAGTFRETVRVSARTGEGLAALEERLAALLLGEGAPAPEQALVTRAHQRDSLRRALDALGRVLENYEASPEFLSIDLRDALDALGEISGETTPEDILDRIFSSFCIGK